MTTARTVTPRTTTGASFELFQLTQLTPNKCNHARSGVEWGADATSGSRHHSSFCIPPPASTSFSITLIDFLTRTHRLLNDHNLILLHHSPLEVLRGKKRRVFM
uniref:Uncharacterized protein n=1 Tax=Panagrellus redivivus TaxID=6233 RepID=A0A7E4V6S9_PANRE